MVASRTLLSIVSYFAVRAWGLLAIAFSLSVPLSNQSAAQIRFAVPEHTLDDFFVQTLVGQSAKSDTPLIVKSVPDSSAALMAVEKGDADLGLFFLDAFIRENDNVRLAPVLTQPFLFNSNARRR
jgi:hypothetical protein